MNDLQTEWTIIHKDIERYECHTLAIKLFAVLISSFSLAYSINELLVISIILVLWLQDGIWKTFQQRLHSRILIIEQSIQNNPNENCTPFQLYTQWEGKRPGAIGLIQHYLSSSIKPTVAYPYVILIGLIIIFRVMNIT